MKKQSKKTINDVWKHLYPKQEREMSERSLNNLVTEKPKWKNLPTQAVRIPKKFVNEILSFARILDEDKLVSSNKSIGDKDMEQAINILSKSLKLPANKGGAIKKEIKQALALLSKNAQHHD